MSAVPLRKPMRHLSLVESPTTLDEHIKAWLETDRQLQSNLWKLAEIAASLTTKYGESDVERFAHEVKRSFQYIYQLADTHTTFENSTRVENLSFTHHKIAARSGNPKEAISIAREKGMSTRELEAWVDDRVAEEKKKLKRRDDDREPRESWGRGRTTDLWEGLETDFLSFTDEQLVFYALSICSRISRTNHLENVEHVLGCDDLTHYIGERKHQLKFRETA